MHKLFFFLQILFYLSYAKEYPVTFANLATPLYKSQEQVQLFSEISSVNQQINNYLNELEIVYKHGFRVDETKDSKDVKLYLKELRKLQKEYDYIIHLVNKEIDKSIQADDYKRFCLLSDCELEGILENTGLKNKALIFYSKNKHKKLHKLLESKIGNDKLLEETNREFYNEIINSTYSSNFIDNSTQSVSIVVNRVKNSIDVLFKNDNFYDVTVRVIPYYQNITPSEDTVDEMVVLAKSTQKYTSLKIGSGETFYSYKYSWMMGSKDAKHDDSYVYRLPYATNTSHLVSQGFNGLETHKGRSRYSIDFTMPIGTEIYAAREGMVVKVKSDSNVGGFDKKFASSGNFIRILHDDGTFATYYHLKRGGVLVNVGQKVYRGTKIGYSGNTGYTSGPHLHFSVFKAVSASEIDTLKIKLLSKDTIIYEPLVRTEYTAQ